MTLDMTKSIDVGLVGLAVLTEAVLVAPLEGIGEVRLLNIRRFSICFRAFAGPIRAAGGTLGQVLIADMIRRRLVSALSTHRSRGGTGREEFGLYAAAVLLLKSINRSI